MFVIDATRGQSIIYRSQYRGMHWNQPFDDH